MNDDTRFEYTVRTCPADDSQELEDLLNDMAGGGWELYSLNEAESEEGEYQYLCIFSKQINGSFEFEDEYIVNAGDFKTTMRRLLTKKEDMYKECRYLQQQIREKNQQISEIKNLLDSSEEIDREDLNRKISEKMGELKSLKSKFSELNSPASMYNRINQDLLTIVVSYELAELIDSEKDGDLIAESVKLRQKLTDELGYVIPGIHFTISDEMNENEFGINVRTHRALRGFVYPGYRRFFPGQSNLENMPEDAIDDIDPITGQKAFWLEKDKTKDFWDKGLSPAQVITSYLDFAVRKYVNDIISYKDVLNYIGLLEDGNTFLADDLFQDGISLADLRYIFANLIKEKISVRDIVYIFEKLNDLSEMDFKTNDELVEQLRLSLSRQICSSIADENNTIFAITVPKKYVQTLSRALKNKNSSELDGFIEYVTKAHKDTQVSVLISPPQYRKDLFNLFNDIIPELIVISESEITEEFTLEES